MMGYHTLDMAEELQRLRGDRLAELEAERDDLVREAISLDPPADDEEAERLQQVEAEFDDLEAAIATITGYIESLEKYVEQWDGGTFEVKELTAGDVRAVKDEVRRQSQESYREGFHELLIVRKAIVDSPPGAPTDGEGKADTKAYPNRIFDWLYERINALNTVGDIEMGNSSLTSRMREMRAQEAADAADEGSTCETSDRAESATGSLGASSPRVTVEQPSSTNS